MLAFEIVEIAVPVAQLELAEVAGHQIGPVLAGDDFESHGDPPALGWLCSSNARAQVFLPRRFSPGPAG